VGEERGKNRAIVTDVTLREYGQNVPSHYLHIFTTGIRAAIARRLIETGFTHLELFSCVHSKIAPAMQKPILKEIAGALGRYEKVCFITLVPNKSGYESFLALNLGPDGYHHTMGVFFSAFEAHNRANLGRSIQETMEEYKPIIQDALSRKTHVVGYVSAAFGYLVPGRKEILKPDLEDLTGYIRFYFDLGVERVTLSDLQGVASAEETRRILDHLLSRLKGRHIESLGYHPHHISAEKAIANSKVAYDLGVRRFDASLGGTGGCVTGAPGNQPTETLVQALKQWGAETGIDGRAVRALAEMVQKELYAKIPLSQVRHPQSESKPTRVE
jgi:hydroxymethylglutaryl-CoA lyase